MRSIVAALASAAVLVSGFSTATLARDRDHDHGDRHARHDFDHDMGWWRGGRWHNGWHEGRHGWWWVANGRWYLYPAPVYPFPDPYRPPVVAVPAPGPQMAYYCANPAGYYPYVAQCFAPWQAMPTAAPAVVAPPAMMVPAAPAPAYAMPVQAAPAPALPGGFGIDKATGGALIGAVGGGLLGAQFGKGSGQLAATAMGTLLGAFVGHQVGSRLDAADEAAARQAEHAAYRAPLGQQIAWNNPASGNSGTITPIRAQRVGGRTCREFRQTVTIDGRTTEASGTACRQRDGSWAVTSR